MENHQQPINGAPNNVLSERDTAPELPEETEDYVFVLEIKLLRLIAFQVFSLLFGGHLQSSVWIRESDLIRRSSPSITLNWAALVSLCIMKLLIFAKPLETHLLYPLEHLLNIISINGGLFKTLYRYLFNQDGFKNPKRGDEDYYSLLGLLDPRQDLLLKTFDHASPIDTNYGVINLSSDNDDNASCFIADLCIMASKLAYEDVKVIKRVVKYNWKMNMVEYLDCWNEHLQACTTQGFILTDKERDANVVVVAFRGTQPFSMLDWCTDFDFSYYKVNAKVGRVHVGFLEALGMGARSTIQTFHNMAHKLKYGRKGGILHDDDDKYSCSKALAYDRVSSTIRALSRDHPRAKVYITGHSLGGALATLFAALFLFESQQQEMAPIQVGGVFTFGQPRVGDSQFASYVESQLSINNKYFRVVFRTDVVPRVPFDDALLQFKHASPCYYYPNTHSNKAQILLEEPYNNIWLDIFLLGPHLDAMRELFESFWKRFVKHYEQTKLFILMQACALLAPGICAHVPSYYIDAMRATPSTWL